MVKGKSSHVVVLVEKINLTGNGAQHVSSAANKAVESWQEKHQSAHIVSAIPATAVSGGNLFLTITLLYRE